MAEETKFWEFRFHCRQQTRAQIRDLLTGEFGRAFSAMWGNDPTQIAAGVTLENLVARARAALEEQAEPDGTRDIIPCPKCNAKNRVPLSGAARCGKCKEVLQ